MVPTYPIGLNEFIKSLGTIAKSVVSSEVFYVAWKVYGLVPD